MKPRSERRREGRSGGPSQGPLARLAGNGLAIAGLVGAGVAAVVAGILLLASGDGGEEPQNDGLISGTPIPVVEPQTEDEIALAELARLAIESLPRGTWGDLYEYYTEEFKERCTHEAFVQSGNVAAQEQGPQLSEIYFAGVSSFDVRETTARLTFVGRVGNLTQYEIAADFVYVDGEWRISPVERSSGCEAFDRLSG